MRIVVLDGFTLNPGDLSWDELRSLGHCEIYDRTGPGDIVRRAAPADALLVNKAEVRREHLRQLPRLRYIGVLATGTNCVDLTAAREQQIPVTHVPAYGTRSVAQTTFALLLELTQRVGHHCQGIREGRWSRNPDWCYWDGQLIELDGLRMGIVGFGRIGRTVSELAAAFGMRVMVCTRTAQSLPALVHSVDLETIFRQSDVLSLHCPLTVETKHLVNAQHLSWMKPTAFLINTSRGPLVEEEALASALNTGRLAGAGLDVLAVEPPPESNPLLQARNCVITPHLAWGTRAARLRLMGIAVENLRSWLAGEAKNVVN
jgi:glycerate dehydrogenase